MRKTNRSLLLSIGLSLLLMACTEVRQPSAVSADSNSPNAPTSSTPVDQPTVQQIRPELGQRLPISAEVMINGQKISLEVAQTPRQQAIGLMHRSSIPDDQGMLFLFEPPRPVQFWMRNVQVPLDMIFLRQGEVQDIAENVPPCSTTTCPTYGPATDVDQVIELRGGRAAELGLGVGDSVEIQFLDAGDGN